MPPGILPTDRDQLFADWSETITLRTITQTYDPDTLQITEATTDTELEALIGLQPQVATPTTAAQHHATLLTITVRSEDIPTPLAPPLTRILYNDLEHRVTAITENPTAQLTTLHSQRL